MQDHHLDYLLCLRCDCYPQLFLEAGTVSHRGYGFEWKDSRHLGMRFQILFDSFLGITIIN